MICLDVIAIAVCSVLFGWAMWKLLDILSYHDKCEWENECIHTEEDCEDCMYGCGGIKK